MIKKQTFLSFPLSFFFFCKVEGGGTSRLVEVVVRTCSKKTKMMHFLFLVFPQSRRQF
jgi:hypothetical protein